MSTEKVHPIMAVSSVAYEVVESEDGVTVWIRSADDHSRRVSILRSALPALIETLQRIAASSS